MTVSEIDARRWRAANSRDLSWVGWDDAFVVYHRPSGKTHFLNPISHFLLTELLVVPAGLADVRAAVPEHIASGEIAALLERFEELGLLEPA